MKDDLASILVSVYNKEEFLPKCLESLRNQTYKNIEIILVDDGSTDDSLSVCKQFEEMDPRIKVIHQENQGLCGARNTSLQNCSGDYIFFVDPDDYVDSSLVKDTISAMKNSNADMVLFGVNIMKGEKCTGGRDWNVNLSSDQLKIISGCINGWELWGRAYRRNLWSGVLFNPELRTSENVYVTGILMEKAKKVIALPKRYYYWQRAPHGSIVQTRKAKSYRDEWIGWKHSKDANSSPLFKEICDKRIMMSATTALLKNKKDKTLTKAQQNEIQKYYNTHSDIPLGDAAAIYYRYMKEILVSKISGKISEKAIKSALKLYAVNSVQRILSDDEEAALIHLIILHRTNNLHAEYKLLQNAIIHSNSFIYKLVGIILKLK
ncbi:glycosyltransferase family 2 protein [Dialister sp.]|uniref:glycosyltransferase family 2 protein n=1 Tax=Dialister sp. TaxID=1955814 RepID=UPI003F1025DA